ncbi:MAG TPA: phosphate acyltransferase [Longimicrobiales bacterium]|nr:phosphate acyltransferase [Longimicrobiales bacterium]
MSHTIRSFEDLHRAAGTGASRPLVVAGAESDTALRASEMAAAAGLVTPHLVGDRDAVRGRLDALGLHTLAARAVLHETTGSQAATAVALIRDGTGEILMKGAVRTDELLRAVVSRSAGLRLENGAANASPALLSDVLLYEHRLDGAVRLVGVTDGGINVQPTASALQRIIVNGVHVMQALGVVRPRVALLSATEAVSEAMPSTRLAQSLQHAHERGGPGGCAIAGPMALDVALLEDAARAKGIAGDVAGRVDLMVVPNIEAGNILGKAVKYYYGSVTAHVVVGARVPVLIPSRVEDAVDKAASIALGVLMAGRPAPPA